MFRWSVILLFGCVLLVNGYPSGAPDSVCDFEGVPGHETDEKEKGTNPYKVVQSSSSYSPGSQITVTISGDEFFRGFFFQAFDKQTGEIIGNWIENDDARIVAPCSGITHTSNSDKHHVTLTWKYTGTESGELYFKGSIVQTYKVYWTHVVATDD